MFTSPRIVWLSCVGAPFARLVVESYIAAGGPIPELVMLVPSDSRTTSPLFTAATIIFGARPRDLKEMGTSQLCSVLRDLVRSRPTYDAFPGAEVRLVNSAHDRDSLNLLHSERPTVLVANSFPEVLTVSALGAASIGALNIHHGRLPSYRGHHATFWEFYDGLDEGTVTVHLMTRQVDAGPVVAVGRIPLSGRSLLGTTIAKKRLGGKLLADAVRAALDGRLDLRASPTSSSVPAARPWPTLRELLTTRLVR